MRVLSLLALLAAACTTLAPPAGAPPPRASTPFSHEDFDQFLQRFVDANGRIDYRAASADRADLDRYLSAIAEVSPESQPDQFPAKSHRLAYWINAYNASVISLALWHYPISSVEDVRAPAPFSFFLPRVAGFFVFHRVVLGGERVTLYGLENGIIRTRFQDPRVHFALNCASRSCPRLPARAFTGSRLEDELERETRRFVSEARNVRLDPERQVLRLSSIFDWYERDFTRWLEAGPPERERSLRGYVLLYASEAEAEAIRACPECRIEFVPYDWTLNDRRPGGS